MAAAEQAPRIKVTTQVAKLVGPTVPREIQLQAARGGVELSVADRLTTLFFLCHSTDAEIKAAALASARVLPVADLAAAAAEAHPPQLLHFVAQLGLNQPTVTSSLLANPGLPEATLLLLARRGSAALLEQLFALPGVLQRVPALAAEVQANPSAPSDLMQRLAGPTQDEVASTDEEKDEEEAVAEEELNLSKYQQALEMEVSEKIKMALTGDKEWRAIFLKDPNKLVHGAVLKNPRITDGEVLALAKSKTSSDEMIRIILLNREWLKNYSIKAALVLHPKTPLPQALRFMSILDLKTLKKLGKSKGVSQVVVNAARRMATEMEKKGR
jgi:hypothetical protein